jgi:hypothetical protein
VTALGLEVRQRLVAGHPRVRAADRDAGLFQQGDLAVGEFPAVVGDVLAFQPGRFGGTSGQVPGAAVAGKRTGQLTVAAHPPCLGRVPAEPISSSRAFRVAVIFPARSVSRWVPCHSASFDAVGGAVVQGHFEVPVLVVECAQFLVGAHPGVFEPVPDHADLV